MIGRKIKNKYEILGILGEGGMGKVFLCRNLEMGTLWAVKQITTNKKNFSLIAEVAILKKLNHLSLPKIVEIIEEDGSTYIVENYIEGIPLHKMLADTGKFSEEQVIKWAKQLCEVINYLHNMKPHPIIYRDMKPSNIIITQDDRAVIVDFGISREFKQDSGTDTVVAYTMMYAAPELVHNGVSDPRSDIYSLGVTLYQLLSGVIPTIEKRNLRTDQKEISEELEFIVMKSIEIDPALRYQTIDELMNDLEKINQLKIVSLFQLGKNKILVVASIVLFMITWISCVWGFSISKTEETATLERKLLVLSKNQESLIQLKKLYPESNNVIPVDENKIIWTNIDNSIANINNGKVIPLQVGSTVFNGKYQGKNCILDIQIIRDTIEGQVNLNYNLGYKAFNIAGNGKHGDQNGSAKEVSILGPKSITCNKKGDIYFVDGGRVKSLINGKISILTNQNGKSLINDPILVRCDTEGLLYVATGKTEDTHKKTIYRIRDHHTEIVYEHQGDGEISDFDFYKETKLCVCLTEPNLDNFYGSSSVKLYNLLKDEAPEIIIDREKTSITKQGMVFDKLSTLDNRIYLTSAENGIVYYWSEETGKINMIAGKSKGKNFIDGSIQGYDSKENFYKLGKIFAVKDALYVIDYNIIRKINLKNGIGESVESIAGKAGDWKDNVLEGRAADVGFVRPLDITVDKEGNIFVADINNWVIRAIKKE